MKLFEIASEQIRKDAFKFLSGVLLSSRIGKIPSDEVLKYLAKSKTSGEYTVFRGISLGHVMRPERLVLNSMQPGDVLPEKYARPHVNQTVIHTTSKEAVAKRYAKGGDASIVYSLKVPNDDVIFDSNGFKNCFDKSDMDEQDWKYFSSEKEILLMPNAKFTATVISTKVNN